MIIAIELYDHHLTHETCNKGSSAIRIGRPLTLETLVPGGKHFAPHLRKGINIKMRTRECYTRDAPLYTGDVKITKKKCFFTFHQISHAASGNLPNDS